MSIPVSISALSERIAERGPEAFLVTTNEDLSPHVVSVLVEQDGGLLVLPAGRSTRRNAERTPSVTLLWAAGPADPYSLIVDARAQPAGADDDRIRVEPRAAILHRMAGRGDGPSCVAIDAPPPLGSEPQG